MAKTKKSLKRILSLVLSIVMVFGMLNLTVLAADTTYQVGAIVCAATEPSAVEGGKWQHVWDANQVDESQINCNHVCDGTDCNHNHATAKEELNCGKQEHSHNWTCWMCDKEEHRHDSSCYACEHTEHDASCCGHRHTTLWRLTKSNSDGDGDGDGDNGNGDNGYEYIAVKYDDEEHLIARGENGNDTWLIYGGYNKDHVTMSANGKTVYCTYDDPSDDKDAIGGSATLPIPDGYSIDNETLDFAGENKTDGGKYDSIILELKVTLIDENGGTHDPGDPIYAPAEAEIKATKTLTGGTLVGGDFSFTLTGEGKSETKTNDASGDVTFPTIKYFTPDTYTYTITERNDGKDGVTYDSSTVTVTVTVADSGEKDENGYAILTADVSYAGDKGVGDNEFVNSCTGTTTTTGSLTIRKNVSGLDAAGKTFKFTVAGVDNDYYNDNVVVNANDFVTLDDLPLGEYTVSENRDDAAVTDYELVKVEGEDSVTLTKDDPSDTVYVINYYEKIEKLGTLVVKKTVVDEESLLKAGTTFKFTVAGVDNDYRKEFELAHNGHMTLTVPVGSYTVTEVDGSTAYYKVTTEGTEGYYDVTENGETTANVVNTVTAIDPDAATAKIVAKKIVDNPAYEGGLDKFTFTLTGTSDNIKGETSTVYSDGNGLIEFNTYYTKAGTYEYTLEEDPGTIAGMEYSDSKYTVSVTVEEDNNKLTVTGIEYSSEKVEFVNTYTTPAADLDYKKVRVGENTPVAVGDTIEYKIVITNSGNADATIDLVEDKGGDGLELQGTTSWPDAFVPAMKDGVAGEWSRTVTAVVTDKAGDSVTNAAVADDVPFESPETPVAKPVLSMEKVRVDGEGPVTVGDTIKYEIRITNSGDADAIIALVEDLGGEGLELQGTTSWSNVFVPAMKDGKAGYWSETVTAKVVEVEGKDITSVQNIAKADGTNIPSDPVDVAKPKLSMVKVRVDGDGAVTVGDTITYEIRITNTGDADATIALVEDLGGEGLELQGTTSWSNVFVPAMKDGKAGYWSETVTAKVVEVEGKDITSVQNTAKAGDVDIPSDPVDVYVTVDVEGTKTWNDEDNLAGLRPDSITINLLADGERINGATVTEEDDWSWSFTGLPKFANGKEIVYTITEDAVDNYTTVVSGYNVTNTHAPGMTSVTVNKVWNDGNNADGIRPASVTVQLYADGEAYGDAVAVTSSYTWSELPMYVEGQEGVRVNYTVAEVNVPAGYTSSVSGYTITNTHVPETTSVSVSKVWVDDNNAGDTRPERISVNLYANGTLYGTVSLTEADGWAYTWSDLTKNANGAEIAYTVTEGAVEGYTSSVEGYTITNTLVEEPEEPEVPEEPEESDEPNNPPYTPPQSDNPTETEPEPESEPVVTEPEPAVVDVEPEPAEPALVDLEDESVPLAELPEEDPPAEPPKEEEFEDIFDDEVPLADVPQTGDAMGIYAAMSLLSGLGLAFLGLKKKDEEA